MLALHCTLLVITLGKSLSGLPWTVSDHVCAVHLQRVNDQALHTLALALRCARLLEPEWGGLKESSKGVCVCVTCLVKTTSDPILHFYRLMTEIPSPQIN